VAYCYLLRCADGSYYVGSTGDLDARVAKHPDGYALKYTASRRPIALAFAERFVTLKAARVRERQIKRWTRAKKEALIAGSLPIFRLVGAGRGGGNAPGARDKHGILDQ